MPDNGKNGFWGSVKDAILKVVVGLLVAGLIALYGFVIWTRVEINSLFHKTNKHEKSIIKIDDKTDKILNKIDDVESGMHKMEMRLIREIMNINKDNP